MKYITNTTHTHSIENEWRENKVSSHHSSQGKEHGGASRAPSRSCCRPDAEAATVHSCADFTVHAYQWLMSRFFCDLLLLRYGHNLVGGYHSFHYCYREFHCKKYNLLPHLCWVCVQEPLWTMLLSISIPVRLQEDTCDCFLGH